MLNVHVQIYTLFIYYTDLDQFKVNNVYFMLGAIMSVSFSFIKHLVDL